MRFLPGDSPYNDDFLKLTSLDFDFLKIDASRVLKRYLLHKQPFYPFILFQKIIQKIYPYSFYFLIFFGYWFNILVVVCIKKYSTFIREKKK